MIDLHCHLLPGIDDGPPDVEGSMAMARRALRAGIETVVATPHVNSRYPNDPATIGGALSTVREALAREQLALDVRPGAEIAVSYLAETDSSGIGALSLAGGEWLLIEPPFATVASGLVTTVQGLLWDGHRVVLAHPERCPAIHRDPSIVRTLVGDGVLMSLTAGSLAGRFGSQARPARGGAAARGDGAQRHLRFARRRQPSAVDRATRCARPGSESCSDG